MNKKHRSEHKWEDQIKIQSRKKNAKTVKLSRLYVENAVDEYLRSGGKITNLNYKKPDQSNNPAVCKHGDYCSRGSGYHFP